MVFEKLFSLFSKKEKTKQDLNKSEMTNVVNSMFLCTPIYDRLKVKCHPDRYIDENQKKIAENLFQELQEYRFNYEKLLEIELLVKKFESANLK